MYARPTHNDLYEDNTIWDMKYEALRILLKRTHGTNFELKMTEFPLFNGNMLCKHSLTMPTQIKRQL